MMGKQINSSRRGRNKTSKSAPRLVFKEQQKETITKQNRSSGALKEVIVDTTTLKQNGFRGTWEGESAKEVTIPEEQEVIIAGQGTLKEITIPEQQELTEDVLCSIISRLRMREAVKTCVLSHGWRHIWTRLPVIKFRASDLFDADTIETLFGESSLLTKKDKFELLLGKADQFIRAVDSLVQQHRGDRVEEFLVDFFLHEIHSQRLDEWVRFSVESKTKKLSFHLGQPFSGKFKNEPFFNSDILLYLFPIHLVAISCVEELCLTYCSLKFSRGLDVFSNLRRLQLYAIDITEADINHLLSNCSALEHIRLQHNNTWLALSIPYHLSKLRSLVVQDCLELNKIEINAINVNTICYRGPRANIIFNQSSRLEYSEIGYIAESKTRSLDYYLSKLHQNLPDIRSLTFRIFGFCKVSDLRSGSCRFIHLKSLVLTWNLQIKMNLLHLVTLLDLAPFIEELKLGLQLFSTRVVEQLPQSLTKLSKMLPKHPHAHIRTVEISGFWCDKWQVEIVLYLLSNAVKLDSMTIKIDQKVSLEIQEMYLKNLSQKVPANVKFVIV